MLRKQGKYIKAGYVYVLVSRKKYVAEHRVVMEGVLGRPLAPGEIVHHANKKRQDNRPVNLKLTTRASHPSIHKKLAREESLRGQLNLFTLKQANLFSQ